MPLDKRLVTMGEWKLDQIKTALQVGSSREPPDKSNNDSDTLKELEPHYTFPFGCVAIVFHHDCGLLVFMATTELERPMEMHKLNYHTVCCSYQDLAIFLE